ncbi:MAG TPA: hypothetical protein VMU59_07170 [Caulobacteraceae bacterium]|nr:hypothetical protein [Caulobacteraceae bacterium]
MSSHNLSTGVPASHIGPETGGTGAATAGEGSSAGTQEQATPSAASGLTDPVPAPTAGLEPRAFEPARTARQTKDGPLDDAPQDLRDIVDGKDRPKHDH